MRIELKNIEKQDTEYKEIYQQCEKELNDKLNPANIIAKNELKVCIEEKESIIGYQLNKNYMEELKTEIELLEQQNYEIEQQNYEMKTSKNTQNFSLEKELFNKLCN